MALLLRHWNISVWSNSKHWEFLTMASAAGPSLKISPLEICRKIHVTWCYTKKNYRESWTKWQLRGDKKKVDPEGFISLYTNARNASSIYSAISHWNNVSVGVGVGKLVTNNTTQEVWCHRGNTFVSHRYDLGLSPGCCCCCWSLTLFHMWDVFHPSQPMAGSFPFGVSFHPQKGSNIFLILIGSVS